MDFNSNSDYPESSSIYTTAESEARPPPPFDSAAFEHCACITTRVYFPRTKTIQTVSNVMVKTDRPPYELDLDGNVVESNNFDRDDDSMISYVSSSDESAADKMENETGVAESANNTDNEKPSPKAYWIQRTLREAIFGKVKYAIVLKKITSNVLQTDQVVEWEVTDEACAVKEQSWQQIRRERNRFAENPIKEVAAMQYLHKYFSDWIAQNHSNQLGVHHFVSQSHVMMPLDILTDDRYLYCVMPYCNGGELFDRLDRCHKFTEDECRYWLNQILCAIETLQIVGICHRDLSLENLLIHNERLCLIIDLGMCIRIPYEDDVQSQTMSDNLDIDNLDFEPTPIAPGATPASLRQIDTDSAQPDFSRSNNSSQLGIDYRRRKRYLIQPSGTCGKKHYMAPEIEQNTQPFDGYAVDMWAVGVILFLMVTGFNPWERPSLSDEKFLFMTNGYLVQMLTEWNLELSADVMDLLQRMLWVDPKDRLSLEQVRAHPWMKKNID